MAIRDYARRLKATLPRAMQASEDRVHKDVQSATPVDTGHARDAVRKASEFVPVEDRYAVFWQARDFPPGEFYVQEMLLAGKDPLTPAVEAERAILPRELAEAIRRVGTESRV